MAKYIPPGFNSAQVIAGLHKAMGFGEPTRVGDKATFYFPVSYDWPPGTVLDEDGVPFDPTVMPVTNTVKAPLKVYCAVEYFDRADKSETFGVFRPTRIEITLLDAEYQQVKDFAYVEAGGDKYVRRSVEPPVALGSIDVWTVTAVAEDET